MQQSVLRLIVSCVFVILGSTLAYGQGGVTSSLSGTVVDTSGAVIPGADVTLKNNATSAVSNAVTTENGTFSIPALNPGTYTATVTLMGFKTVVLNDVVINAATPASIRVTLEVGALAETIQVRAASEIVQTQTSMVSATLDANQITRGPTPPASSLIPFVSSSNVPSCVSRLTSEERAEDTSTARRRASARPGAPLS